MNQYIFEYRTTYPLTLGDTVYTVTSECPEDATEDILDALARLIQRDVAGVETERR